MRSAKALIALLFVGSAMAWRVAVGEPSSAPSGLAPAAATQWSDDFNTPYDSKYHFVRVRYDGGGGGFGGFRRGRRGGTWSHDYPRAERNFLQILKETTYGGTPPGGTNGRPFDDAELTKDRIGYIGGVGHWHPSDEEVRALGEYLLKGGFLIVDDTRGERGFEYRNFASHMERALPGLSLVPLAHDHDIFDSFFRVDPLAVIPLYGPRDVQYYAIFEDNDPEKRMMVVFNFNNDIAEYWEFSDVGWYSIDLTNEAFKLGVNYIVYAHTH